MALRFDQKPLPDGVYAIVTDDGQDVAHIFTECAPWPVVRRAMAACASRYADGVWERRPLSTAADPDVE